jgi:MoxR-like ATPase
MAWSNVIKNYDTVSTEHGIGTVKRISQSQNTAHVEVDGQLFEVPLESIGKVEGVQPQEGAEMFEKGDLIKKTTTGREGEVTEVTQRTVKVKWSDGRSQNIPKKEAQQELEKTGKSEAKPEQKPEVPVDSKEVKSTADSLYGLLQLQKQLEDKIDESVSEEFKELKKIAEANQKLEIKLGDKTYEIKGLKHKQLQQLITYASLRLSPLLVGMAGTGKTHAAEQVADALDLDFYSMSVGAQTSKSDIIGYMNANGGYVSTHFRTAYENGGIFLMDEIDAGNANVLIQVNAALSNGLCAFPDKMVKKHDDFVFIASANTYGNGANRQYVGRNQLDAATLDRFAIIDWLIDDNLEEQLAVGAYGKAWYTAVRAVRDYVAEHNIRALISPRATQKGSKLLDVGQDVDEVVSATLLGSVPDDKRSDVRDIAVKVFNNHASDVPSNIVEVSAADLVRNITSDDISF